MFVFAQECDDHIAAQLQKLADNQASDPIVFLEQVRRCGSPGAVKETKFFDYL